MNTTARPERTGQHQAGPVASPAIPQNGAARGCVATKSGVAVGRSVGTRLHRQATTTAPAHHHRLAHALRNGPGLPVGPGLAACSLQPAQPLLAPRDRELITIAMLPAPAGRMTRTRALDHPQQLGLVAHAAVEDTGAIRYAAQRVRTAAQGEEQRRRRHHIGVTQPRTDPFRHRSLPDRPHRSVVRTQRLGRPRRDLIPVSHLRKPGQIHAGRLLLWV